jgi:hypothetical protein
VHSRITLWYIAGDFGFAISRRANLERYVIYPFSRRFPGDADAHAEK